MGGNGKHRWVDLLPPLQLLRKATAQRVHLTISTPARQKSLVIVASAAGSPYTPLPFATRSSCYSSSPSSSSRQGPRVSTRATMPRWRSTT
ncbi:hypothetical protein ACLB2K_030395 [Fragaria x ananassa]